MSRCTYKRRPAQNVLRRTQFEAMQGTIELRNFRKRTPRNEDLEDRITAQQREIEILRERICQLEASKDSRLVETSEDPCFCRRCGDRFTRPAYMRRHRCWPGHPREGTPLFHPFYHVTDFLSVSASTRCETCKTVFARFAYLELHQKTCQSLDGKDSTAHKELHVEAVVRNPVGSAHPQSEVCSLVSSRSAIAINHADTDRTFSTSSSYSNVDAFSVTNRGEPVLIHYHIAMHPLN